jgi:hypothetical protein
MIPASELGLLVLKKTGVNDVISWFFQIKNQPQLAVFV